MPNSCCCTGAAVWRSTSGSVASSSAPSTTPATWPMPPSTTMHSTMIDSTDREALRADEALEAENSPPATPPKVAPMAKASSLMLRVLIPMACAAISSSRIATQARPMRESSRRRCR